MHLHCHVNPRICVNPSAGEREGDARRDDAALQQAWIAGSRYVRGAALAPLCAAGAVIFDTRNHTRRCAQDTKHEQQGGAQW